MNREMLLIKKCQRGDLQAFEELIEPYQKKIFNMAYRMLDHYEDASDAAQEILVKIYKAIVTFKGDASLSTWIYRIATNVCIDELRKKKKTTTISIDASIKSEDGDFCLQIQDPASGPDTLLERKEMNTGIHKAISMLNEEHKAVIILRDINNFTYEEIAKMLHCSLGTVKSRISRARNNLKMILMRDMELMKEKNV